MFPTTTFRSAWGRSLKILSRTSAGNVLLMHPAAILASIFFEIQIIWIYWSFSRRIKFWTCLHPWTDHLTPAVPVPHFAHSTMVGRSSSDMTSDLPGQSRRPGQFIWNLTRQTIWLVDSLLTCWRLKCWPSDLLTYDFLTSDLTVWHLDCLTSWPSDLLTIWLLERLTSSYMGGETLQSTTQPTEPSCCWIGELKPC